MKKIKDFKFNRFNIIIMILSLLLLLFFLFAYFHSYAEYVVRPASNRNGDTIYINDLASDYYHYLGMNYVGDLNSNTVAYQESDLKMVTINYYGYPSGNTNETGYVSLNANERQNKFVYYKYFPIKNNQISFDLIDNPFSDRPKNKGFNGWTSSDGTITTDSNTKIQHMTVSSSVDTINIYASWANANVVYLKGETGDDNFDGTRPDRAVGSWSRAFQLLRNRTSNQTNRELNIIVLMGNIDYSINYSVGTTQTYRSITTTYTETNSLDEEVLLAYQNGNNLYGIIDNNGNVDALALANNIEITDTYLWYVTPVSGGYTIRNKSTNRYLTGTQNGNNVSLTLGNNSYTWSHDGDINGFYNDFTITYTIYHYDVSSTLTSGNNYFITSGTNPQNALNGAGNNFNPDINTYLNTAEWRFTNTGGNNYSIRNVGNNQYLNYSNANNSITLALSNTALNWTYDSTNSTLSALMRHVIDNSTFPTKSFTVGDTGYLGSLNGNTATLLTVSGNNTAQVSYGASDTIPRTAEWEVVAGTGGTYRLRSVNNNRYLARNGNNSTALTTSTSTTNANWSYDATNHRLYTTRNYTTYNLYNNNGTWATSTNANTYTPVYFMDQNIDINQYDEIMYLAYNGGWLLENIDTNASIDLTVCTPELVSEEKSYYVRYSNNDFVLEPNTTGANLKYFLYNTTRTIQNTNSDAVAANGNYQSGNNNVAATITSLYNHTDYRSSATWDLTSASNSRSQVVAYKDLQLEYLHISATGFDAIDDGNAQTSYRTSYASLVGNAYNVRVGRGMTPTSWDGDDATTFCYAMGGSNDRDIGSTSNDNNSYRFVIESGRLSGLALAQLYNNNSTGYDYYGQANLILGNDYDRALKNNDNLEVYYRIASSTYSGISSRSNVKDMAYLMNIKSGSFGRYFFDNNPNNNSKAYAGIYVGGMVIGASASTHDEAARVLLVEGGDIANINGGLRIRQSDGTDGVLTKIYVKNGSIYNIVGGAGLTTTYGDRYLSITGGSVSYSVSGGSNGYLATGSGSDGKLSGDIYVHIGGEAKIGTAGSGELYLVPYGSVLGAGNGNSNVTNSGESNSSHIYISDDAIIYGSVYGGGNWGDIVEDVHINIDGGTVHGNVYGGANRNGVGSVNINESTIYNITFDDNKTIENGQSYLINKVNGNTRNMLSENGSQATTNSVYNSGTQPSNNARWTITTATGGYKIRNLNYNHYLAYTTNSSPSLTISTSDANNVWGYDNTNKTFYSDIDYIVSETVNYNYTNNSTNQVTSGVEYVITNTESQTAYSLNSDRSRVYLSSTSEPDSNAWIFNASGNGYTIRNKSTNQYLTVSNRALATSNSSAVWTWDQNNHRLSTSVAGWLGGSTTYYLRYNNGWTVSTSQYSVYLASYSVTRVTDSNRFYLVFNNSWQLSTTPSSVMLSTFTSTSGTGYSVSGQSNGDVNITMNDGTVKGAIYGGACQEGDIAGSVTININGGSIESDSENGGSIFGGGYGKDTFVAGGVDLNINDTKNVVISGTVYGGSALGTIIGNVDVDSVDNSGNGTISITGNMYCGSMGDDDDDDTGIIQGNCSLDIDGGTYSGSVFGGNNANGSPTGTIVVTTGGNNNTVIGSVYGGGNEADTTATNVTLNIENNSSITNAYGGGNEAAVPITHVNLHGGTATNIFGGSNSSGDITTSNIVTTGGTATNIYGGNNLGGTTSTSNITIGGGNITNVYGGGNEATTGTTNITLNSGSVSNTYGGGNKAGITTSTNVTLDGSTCGNVFGGSNTSGDVPVSYVTATSGTATNIYGGNNVGGVTTTSNVSISNITAGTVYGGGKQATTGTTNVTINSGTLTNVFGGGESANVTTSTTVDVLGGSITDVYGGSNTTGTVPVSNVNITSGTIGTVYGGNNAGGTTTTTNVTIDGGSLTEIYGGGKAADSTTTHVTLNDSTNTITNIFGGGKQASATTTYVVLNDGTATNVYGGSNTSGNITTSNVTVNDGTYTNVYGGNNDGGTTTTTNVTILDGNVTNVFGGGNNAPVGATNLTITGATVSGNAYGGGNNAAVNGNTNVLVSSGGTVTHDLFGGGNNGVVTGNTVVNMNGGIVNGSAYGGGNNASVSGNTNITLTNTSRVTQNLFGGGNNGTVLGSTNVDIVSSSINGSAYAGGNGGTAIVSQNTSITVQGNTNITNHVFGGGNAAATGSSANDNSNGVVNITGGVIGGNVYGGANTSVLYGETVVNIGLDAVAASTGTSNYQTSRIYIGGTVFGGGEANASGSEVYDFDFISVTQGIIININGNGYSTSNFEIAGSIFGSGNASRTTGYSRVYISNYGSSTDIKNNISLQRADLAVLNNTHIALEGATDRTNEYSQVLFSLSRITELDLKNNSAIYMENGANLLNRLRSLDANGNLATVTIDENTHAVTRNTNNQLYMEEDQVLNIATNQNVTSYGEVDGMTFFGMYKRDRNGNIVTAMYNPSYETGDAPGDGEMYYFSSGSYVLGSHETNHDIRVDGFYTNYEDEANPGQILVDYIHPTPEDAEHYMWTIGVSVQSYDIELIASKYSTLGTSEFSFINNTHGNTTFSIVGFSYDDLDANVSLIEPDSIPRIASSGTVADNTMGLAIKPGIGWLSVGETYFLTDSNDLYRGATSYKSENSNLAPSFIFYLYHSKNLATAGLVGRVVVSVLVVTPINDLKNEIERINFNVTITRALYNTTDYEGAMTPGRQYSMFTSSNMDITSKSSLSAYYSLFVEPTPGQPVYRTGYHRVLSSNILLPVNTKITMIDFASSSRPQYYYYIVNQADNNLLEPSFQVNGTAEYALSKFIRMGSSNPNNHYDDATANSIYFDPDTNMAIEEFIFILDFANTDIQSNMLNNSLLIEMHDSGGGILYSVLGIERDNMIYNLYANQASVVDVSATVSKNLVYVGDIQDLRINTNFNQNNENSTNRIIDTTYYDQKLGLKVSFFDENGRQVNGVDLMGTSLTLDGQTYYARSDGTFRFKISDRVANVYSNIKINTTNSSLTSGNYTVRVDVFYSPDGIYYGSTPADTCQVTFRLMARLYGLKVTIPDNEVVITGSSGKTINKQEYLHFSIDYSGALLNPAIKLVLYRRNYNQIYETNYTMVDLLDFIYDELDSTIDENIYDAIDELEGTNTLTLQLQDTIRTGTYKLEFRLYDGDSYVGEVYKYLIVK